MVKKKKSNQRSISWIGLIGSLLILIGIVGGFFSEIFAFWKFEGNVPSLIEGGIYFLPFNKITTMFTGLEPFSYMDSLILFIYIPFIVVSIFGLIGSLSKFKSVAIIGGIIGLVAVPVSMYLVMQIMTGYNLVSPGSEFSGLFSYNNVSGSGTYTIGLWVGFFLCAAGSYILLLGIPKSKSGGKK